MPEARKATAADVDAIAAALARAFEDDPLMDYIFPARARLDRVTRFFAYELRATFLGYDEVWTTGDCRGAAVWAPPDKWRLPIRKALRGVPTMLRVLGARVAPALRAQSTVARAHPPGPHYYLASLGTDPAYQGTGVGSTVLTPVLDRCDREGIGAYLESSKEKNLPFYSRQGFEVTRELPLPGGPSVWLMWREPR